MHMQAFTGDTVRAGVLRIARPYVQLEAWGRLAQCYGSTCQREKGRDGCWTLGPARSRDIHFPAPARQLWTPAGLQPIHLP